IIQRLSFGINYIIIDLLLFTQFPSAIFLLLAICFYLSFANFFPFVPPLYFLVGFLSIIGLIFFCPFPILYYNVRRWFIVTMVNEMKTSPMIIFVLFLAIDVILDR